jgi:Arm DNA-binding domain
MPTSKPHRVKLTQASISRLKPSEDGRATTFWDINMPGFGLRISPLGRKTWIAQFRVRGAGGGGKDVEVVQTFGTLDKVTLSDAQALARISFAKAREGVHPVRERKQRAAAEQSKRAADAFTFKALADRYMTEYVYLNTKASTAKENRRLLERACLCQITPTRELSPNFGDGLKDQAAAWA